MNLRNVKSISLNYKPISEIDTDSLSNDSTHIPSSAVIKNIINNKINYISDAQHEWDITKYIPSNFSPSSEKFKIEIPDLYCSIILNDSVEYHELISDTYTTENYNNTKLISSKLEEYTNITDSTLNNVCSIFINDDYPFSTIYIPPIIKFTFSPPSSTTSSSSPTEYKYTPQILYYDHFYNISHIKAPTVKIFTNTQIGHQTVKDNLVLENAAVIKCLDNTTIYENIPVNLMTKFKIIPNAQFIQSSNHELIPSPDEEIEITNSITYPYPIVIKTHSEPANLLAFVKKNSVIINSQGTSTTYQMDTLYHNKIASSIKDSDYPQLSIQKNYLTLPPNTELRLNYGSIIYPFTTFSSEFEILYNNQQFSLKNIENHGIARNPNNDVDKQLDGIYVIGGTISYNRSNQENKIFLPKDTILTPGSLITLSSTYQYNQQLDINSILGPGNYASMVLNYYNTQNINTYIILNTTTLTDDLYLPCINTDNIWKSWYSYPVLVANVLSYFPVGTELYDVSSYYNLNNSIRPILSSSYRNSLSDSSQINYKDYSFIIRNSEFETINSNVYGYANHITITGGTTQTGTYTISTSFGKTEIQKYKNCTSNSLIINVSPNLQVAPPILRNFTLIIHCSQNTTASINDSGKIVNLTAILDETHQYIIYYAPDTTIYDLIYNACKITLINGSIYLIELVPTVLNISGEYYDNEEYVKIVKNVRLSNEFEIDSINNTVYTKYNTLLKSGTKIAKNSVVNGVKYTSDYIIPISNTPIQIPSKPAAGSLLTKDSIITAGSILNDEKINSDIILPENVIISDSTKNYLNINSQIAPGSILTRGSLLNGQPISNNINVDGFLVIEIDSELAVGSIVSAGSFITFEGNMQYVNRNDLIIAPDDTLKLYSGSVIDKGSKITIGSFVNNKEVEYSISSPKEINNESIISNDSILNSNSVLNIGSVLNGNYIRGDNSTLTSNVNINSFTRILKDSVISAGADVKSGSVINGETILGEFDVITIQGNDYICEGNETYTGNYLTYNTNILSGSKLIIGSNYVLNSSPTTITITQGDRKTITESEREINWNINYLSGDIIKSGSKISSGSIINGDEIENYETEIAGDVGIPIADAGLNILSGSTLKRNSKLIIGTIIDNYEYTNIDKTPIQTEELITINQDNQNLYSTLNNSDILLRNSKIYSGSIINGNEINNFEPELNHNYRNNQPDTNGNIMTKILKDSIILPGNIINGTREEGTVIDSSDNRHENTTVNLTLNQKIAKTSRIIGGSTINNVEYPIDWELIEITGSELIVNDSNNSQYVDRVVAVNSTVLVGSVIQGITVEETVIDNVDCSNIQSFNIQRLNKYTNISHVIYYHQALKKILLLKEFTFISNVEIDNSEVYYAPGSTYYAWSDTPQTGSTTIWQNLIKSGTIMAVGSTISYSLIERIINSGWKTKINIPSNYGEFVDLDGLELTYRIDTPITINNAFVSDLPFYAAPGSIINGQSISTKQFYGPSTYLSVNDVLSTNSRVYSGFVVNSTQYNKLSMPYDTFTAYNWDGYRISTATFLKGSKVRLLKEYVLDDTITVNNSNSRIAIFSKLTRILNDNITINSNSNTIINNSPEEIECSGYIILQSDTTISSTTILSIQSEIAIGSTIKEYSTYHLLESDIHTTTNNSILKSGTWLIKDSVIKYSTGLPYIILDSDITVSDETRILSGSVLTQNSIYYEKYKTLSENITNIKTITCYAGSEILIGSTIIKLINSIKHYNTQIEITSNSVFEPGSIITYGSIIVSGSQINNKLIYGERTILYSPVKIEDSENYLIKSGSIILKDSIIHGVKLDNDLTLGEDVNPPGNIYLISGSTINSGSYLGDTDFPQNREIEYNYSNGTLLNENSIVSENTKLMKGSIINDEEITNIYVEDDIHIYNTSTIEIGSVILNGSLIKKDSIINNRKYMNDELLNSDLTVLNSGSNLEKGTIVKSGSLITTGSRINNVIYNENTTLINDVEVENYSELIEGSSLITGSKIVKKNENIDIVGNIEDDGHFDENHGGNVCHMKIKEYGSDRVGPPVDFIRILVDEELENKYTYLTIDNLVVADVCCIVNEDVDIDEGNGNENNNNVNNNNNSNTNNNGNVNASNLKAYVLVKQDPPIYNVIKVGENEVVILNQDSIIANGDYESIDINVIKVFNSSDEEPYGKDINKITIESDYFYSSCFNLKKSDLNENISHVILKNQKIIDPSNIIVNYGSNIIFDTERAEQIYIIPSEFTHVDLPKNNGWYRNCITKCLEYNDKLIYGIDEAKIMETGRRGHGALTDMNLENYVFNLFNLSLIANLNLWKI